MQTEHRGQVRDLMGVMKTNPAVMAGGDGTLAEVQFALMYCRMATMLQRQEFTLNHVNLHTLERSRVTGDRIQACKWVQGNN